MALLIVLTVFMTSLTVSPAMLSAAILSAQGDITMMKDFTETMFKPIAITVSAIWCSCIASGQVPRLT
ncbi:hypothetical protein [Pseudomonas atacamensis]|uniref:hypothetical protein n=1 Tax=Pseudomonas atacamensis TaxID=2565368 RepID=UPI00300EAB23